MSVQPYAYFGPFFLCTARVATRVVAIRACPEPACMHHGRTSAGAYCPACGTAIDAAFPHAIATTVPDLGDVLRAVDERLACDWKITPHAAGVAHHYWRPNVRRGGPREFEVPNACALTEADFDPAGEKAWLLEAFAAEHATLVTMYGVGEVRAEWGVIRCWL